MKVVFFIFTFGCLLSFILTAENRQFLSKGEQLNYLELIDKQNKSFGLKNVKIERNVLIIIISNSCYTCNKNFPIWNRLTNLDGLSICGVVSNMGNLFQLGNTNLAKFRVYTPVDYEKFKTGNFVLNEAVDYTILLKQGKVVFFRIGQLNMDNYFHLRNLIKD
jgi:hypothetical protein